MKLADELVQHFIGDVEVSIFLVQPTVQDLLIGLVGDGVGMHDVRSPGVECLEHVSSDSAIGSTAGSASPAFLTLLRNPLRISPPVFA